MHDGRHTPAHLVLAAYEWSPGHCFRCGGDDDQTAAAGHLRQGQRAVEIIACVGCILILERQREDAAERYGWPYSPGTPRL